jgi:hypothetical protein
MSHLSTYKSLSETLIQISQMLSCLVMRMCSRHNGATSLHKSNWRAQLVEDRNWIAIRQPYGKWTIKLWRSLITHQAKLYISKVRWNQLEYE